MGHRQPVLVKAGPLVEALISPAILDGHIHTLLLPLVQMPVTPVDPMPSLTIRAGVRPETAVVHILQAAVVAVHLPPAQVQAPVPVVAEVVRHARTVLLTRPYVTILQIK